MNSVCDVKRAVKGGFNAEITSSSQLQVARRGSQEGLELRTLTRSPLSQHSRRNRYLHQWARKVGALQRESKHQVTEVFELESGGEDRGELSMESKIDLV